MKKVTVIYRNAKLGITSDQRLIADLLPLYWSKPEEVENADGFDGEIKVAWAEPRGIRDVATATFDMENKLFQESIIDGLKTRSDIYSVE